MIMWSVCLSVCNAVHCDAVCGLQQHECSPTGTARNFSRDRSGAWKKVPLGIGINVILSDKL